MLSWEKQFSSRRADGRYTGTLAAWMAEMRNLSIRLAFTPECTRSPETFRQWQQTVRARLVELLKMPQAKPQPPPRRLSAQPRDGYTVERWEFYPDDYSAVPFLLLRPEPLAAPAPGILCVPGSAVSKELLAGEPLLDNPNCANRKLAERNAQALHCVRRGMIAAAFDNPGTAELAELDSDQVETQWGSREKLVQGYLDGGTTYLGMSVFQKLRFLEWFRTLPEVHPGQIAVMGHSLGSEAAMALGLISDDIAAVVFNDFLCDERRRYVGITELPAKEINDGGNWHMVPGAWREFAFPDLLAAMVPKYLAINEGGAEEFLDKVRRSYEFNGVADRLKISYYPRFAETPKKPTAVPLHGLEFREFYEDYSSVDVPDHSFRPEVSLELLQQAFAQS